MGYFIRTYLNKFRDVSYETREFDGEIEECIIIPMRRNGIKHTEHGSTVLNFAMNEKRPNVYKQTHFISIMADDDILAEAKELGFEQRMRYFGYAKLVYNKKGTDFSGKRVDIDDAMNID